MIMNPSVCMNAGAAGPTSWSTPCMTGQLTWGAWLASMIDGNHGQWDACKWVARLKSMGIEVTMYTYACNSLNWFKAYAFIVLNCNQCDVSACHLIYELNYYEVTRSKTKSTNTTRPCISTLQATWSITCMHVDVNIIYVCMELRTG